VWHMGGVFPGPSKLTSKKETGGNLPVLSEMFGCNSKTAPDRDTLVFSRVFVEAHEKSKLTSNKETGGDLLALSQMFGCESSTASDQNILLFSRVFVEADEQSFSRPERTDF